MKKETHIFADVLEPDALTQFESAMEQSFAVKGALMPDAHSGYSLPIGAVVATEDVIVPAWVGYDQGCGVAAIRTVFNRSDVEAKAKEIYEMIYKVIPVGFSHNQKDQVWDAGCEFEMSNKLCEIFAKNGLKQLCSLGGGNHFVELGYDELDKVWVTVHSGSRGIGHAVATHYMKLASGSDKAEEGHYGFDVNSAEGKHFIMDLNFCLEFALENRKQILRKTVAVIGHILETKDTVRDWVNLINRNHNHAELKDGLWIHRKGATHAEAGMLGMIPGNMRDGSFIVRGKGNPDALWSSSHGAGRVLGRKAAQRTLNLEDFKESMKGITANVTAETIDESAFAYKNIWDVMAQQTDMVEVLHHIKPIINIKG